MNTEALAARFRAVGCTPTQKRKPYSSLLVRCGCGRHAMAAAACGGKPAETVKLLGAALSWYAVEQKKGPLTFVVGKDQQGNWQKAVEALQSLQPQAVKVELQVDFEKVESVSRRDLHDPKWVAAMLGRGDQHLPHGAEHLETGALDLGFRWYRSVTGPAWSGRLNGLQVCMLETSGRKLEFSVGKDGKADRATGARGVSSARTTFLKILRENARRFGIATSATCLTLDVDKTDDALAFVKHLADGGLSEHGSQEHLLEAKVLRGDVKLRVKDGPLEPIKQKHPFQFPARWWQGGTARFIDVMARQGSTPWVVELKIDGSQGAYYRDGIIQTALYLEYVRRSVGLDRWFDQHSLKRAECRAALVVAPFHGPAAEMLREDHTRVARELGVELIEEPAAAQ